MAFVSPYLVKKVLLFHNRLSAELKLGEDTVGRDEYLYSCRPLLDMAGTLVFVSESKRDDWGLASGNVIMPGVDPDEFLPYEGSQKAVLRVANQIRERTAMLGYSVQEEICQGLPSLLIGENPTVENSNIAKSFDDLKAAYSRNRVYLNTTNDLYEDGYNLAMLEAMCSGMPIVSTANSTSPITDGAEGFISDDIDYLRSGIKELLGDIKLARQMGAKAKETVIERFGINDFVDAWDRAFEETCHA